MRQAGEGTHSATRVLDPERVELVLDALLADDVDTLVGRQVEDALEVGRTRVGRAEDLLLFRLRPRTPVSALRLSLAGRSDGRTTWHSMPILSNFFLFSCRDLVALFVTKKIWAAPEGSEISAVGELAVAGGD